MSFPSKSSADEISGILIFPFLLLSFTYAVLIYNVLDIKKLMSVVLFVKEQKQILEELKNINSKQVITRR